VESDSFHFSISGATPIQKYFALAERVRSTSYDACIVLCQVIVAIGIVNRIVLSLTLLSTNVLSYFNHTGHSPVPTNAR